MQTQENGSTNYQIKHLTKFDRTYAALIKKYYRKNAKAREEFEQIIADYKKELEINPCLDSVSDAEPFPANTAEPDFDFRKKRWRRLPGLQGAARLGRLLFIVCHSRKTVYLMWIYTHAEYQEPNSRPSDKELKAEINFLKEEIAQETDIEDS